MFCGSVGLCVPGKALLERLPRGTPVHAPALVGALSIVGDKVLVQDCLHLFDGLEPGAPALDPEVFVEQRAVEPFHDAVGLRTVGLRGAMLDVLELQEQLVGVTVGTPAELPPLSESTTSMRPRAASKVGNTSWFIR